MAVARRPVRLILDSRMCYPAGRGILSLPTGAVYTETSRPRHGSRSFQRSGRRPIPITDPATHHDHHRADGGLRQQPPAAVFASDGPLLRGLSSTSGSREPISTDRQDGTYEPEAASGSYSTSHAVGVESLRQFDRSPRRRPVSIRVVCEAPISTPTEEPGLRRRSIAIFRLGTRHYCRSISGLTESGERLIGDPDGTYHGIRSAGTRSAQQSIEADPGSKAAVTEHKITTASARYRPRARSAARPRPQGCRTRRCRRRPPTPSR